MKENLFGGGGEFWLIFCLGM